MFARYFVELQMPQLAVVESFLGDVSAWLPRLATNATRDGDRLLADAGVGTMGASGREVTIELGSPATRGSTAAFPLHWTPLGAVGSFPALDADLEVSHLGRDRTQVAVSARFSMPFGPDGRVADRTLVSRVVDATIKTFLDGVADAVVADSGTSGTLAVH